MAYRQDLNFMNELVRFLVGKARFVDDFNGDVERLPPMPCSVHDSELSRAQHFITENLNV